MDTNAVSSQEDTEMAECDGEKVVTMMDVLQEQQEFEEDANAVLGASDDKNCTYPKGYIKRQAIYACLTCCGDARTDDTKRAGVCLACSLNCHENHELIELYTKRNFRCDCGNPKFNSHPCTFTPNKTELNQDNNYNQNFSGVYCVCHRPYPDPDSTTEDEMIQCIICEDWLHAAHLEAIVPPNDQYAEMICKGCMEKNDFLHDYSGLIVNIDNVDVDVMNGDDTICNGSIAEDGLNGIIIQTIQDSSIDNKVIENGTLENSLEKNDVSSEKKVEEGITNGDIEMDKVDETKTTEKENSLEKNDVSSEKNLESEGNVDVTKPDENINAEGDTTTDPPKNIEEEINQLTTEHQENLEPTKPEEATEVLEKDKSTNGNLSKENDEQIESKIIEESINDEKPTESEESQVIDEKSEITEQSTTISSESNETNIEPENKTDNLENAVGDSAATESLPETTTTADKCITDITSNLNCDTNEPNDISIKEKENIETNLTSTEKRKLTEDEDSTCIKKPKLNESTCIRPKGVKKLCKGATFWPSNFRQKLCTCNECITMYKDLSVLFLIDPEDTVTAYETLGQEKIDGEPTTQYEKGMQALSSLDRIQQINALTEYNKMRDKLLDFLKSFKDRKEVVKEEDIKAFFAGMKPKREPDGVYFCR